ncbi:hypothetical protein HDU93_005801, partial [Gonapodya sp. JEL0774]
MTAVSFLFTVLLVVSVALIHQPAAVVASADPTILLCKVNRVRADNGLPPFGLDDRLTTAALAHSTDQSINTGVSHFGSDGTNPLTRLAFIPGWLQVSENVAGRFPDESTVLGAWLDAPSHRAAILGPFNCYGSAD